MSWLGAALKGTPTAVMVAATVAMAGATATIAYYAREGLEVVAPIAENTRLRNEKALLLDEMKKVSARLKAAEPDLRQQDEALHAALLAIPNPPHADAPDGAGDEANVVLRQVGTPATPAFEILDHLDLGELRGWIDMKRAAKVSGARFAFLMGELVNLEFALVRFALDRLAAEGFKPVVPPILVREAAMYGTGFYPAARNEISRQLGELDGQMDELRDDLRTAAQRIAHPELTAATDATQQRIFDVFVEAVQRLRDGAR